ncbi:MAG: tetratricopeptide repeat protein [Sphingopyxis sp.]|nr:tetratricopeptide repeat protein [Sphingopyxis sp.]
MRVSALALVAGLVLASHAAPTGAMRADNAIEPLSLHLAASATEAQARGDLDAATDYFESALAVDPRNRAAFLGLAQIARTQGLPGKAIGFYREALLIEPRDVAALAGQGEAMVEKGAIELARQKLADARKFCRDKCPQVAGLEAAIAKGEARRTMSAEAVMPRPVVTGGDDGSRN